MLPDGLPFRRGIGPPVHGDPEDSRRLRVSGLGVSSLCVSTTQHPEKMRPSSGLVALGLVCLFLVMGMFFGAPVLIQAAIKAHNTIHEYEARSRC